MVLLKTLAVVLGVVGVLVLADAVLTVVWQEPLSGLLAHFQQNRLAQNLKRLEGQRTTPADERALAALPTDNERIAFFAHRLQQTAVAAQAVARIRIPRIGADFVVVAGTDESSLQKGPGIYAGTAVPGLRGTVGIAGHRTTYLAPFRRINELAKGDRITLEMPYGLFTYTVLGHRIVSPGDVSVLQRASYDQVVLTACHPLYSAAQRIVVFARLTAAAPAGPALSAVPLGSPPALLPAAEVAAGILGDAPAVAPGLAGGEPAVDIPGVILGIGAQPPAPPVRPRPGKARPAPTARRVPARGVAGRPAPPPAAPPPSSPVPAGPPPRSPVPARTAPAAAVPRQPERVRRPAPPPVSRPAPAPVRRPAANTPASSPSAPRPAVQPQTRVQGSPGGPTPIIEVPTPPG